MKEKTYAMRRMTEEEIRSLIDCIDWRIDGFKKQPNIYKMDDKISRLEHIKEKVINGKPWR